MRSCFQGQKRGGKEQYLCDPLRVQAVEKELPDKSHSRGGTQLLPEGLGVVGGASRGKNTLISLFSYPLISCHYFPLAEHCRALEPKESK